MILRKIRDRKESKRKKKIYYKWILEKNIPDLQALFSSPEFYKLPKAVIFRLIHKSTHNFDPHFRNTITDSLLSEPLYVAYMRKHLKKFPL